MNNKKHELLADEQQIDPSAFNSTSFEYDWHNDFNNLGYKVEVDVFNAVYVTDLDTDITFNLGNYVTTNGTKMTYTNGTDCPALGRGRETEVLWNCGDQTEITKVIESSVCIYKIYMTKECTSIPGKNRKQNSNKL